MSGGSDVTRYIPFDGWRSEDPAVVARVRGRAITSALARLVRDSDQGRFWVDMRSVLAGGPARYNVNAGSPSPGTNDLIPPTPGVPHLATAREALRQVWETHIDPSGGY